MEVKLKVLTQMLLPETQNTLWRDGVHKAFIQPQVCPPLHGEELDPLARLFLKLWEALGEDM